MTAPLLNVEGLSTVFEVPVGLFRPAAQLRAVSDISFVLAEGETLGVVGESGCGKSTLGRSILRLIEPTSGHVGLAGAPVTGVDDETLRRRRRDMQIVFQDPIGSLNPRMTIGDIIAEPLTVFEPQLSIAERQRRVLDIMEQVGLQPQMINRYAHEFSGGQAQRIGIARAIVLKPRLVICDEPVSALDVSVQAQIVNLLIELKKSLGLAMIFISHDLSVVRYVSDRIMVLYLGRIVEVGERGRIFSDPTHPYTQALLAAALVPDPAIAGARPLEALEGEIPSPLRPPSGCAFRTRCPLAADRCAAEKPLLRTVNGRQVACHFA